MAHVELSVTDPYVPEPFFPEARDRNGRERIVRERPPTALSSLERWAVAARGAQEPCLVTDHLSQIVAVSAPACELLGLNDPDSAVGMSLFGGMLRLLDFTAAGTALAEGELEKTPPVLAVFSARLARGLMRVQSRGEVLTLDAVATPLFDGQQPDAKVVGALTFLLQI